MNIVEIEYEEYKKYLHDTAFITTQMNKYAGWLLEYNITGRVALYNFALSSNGIVKMFFVANHDINNDRYSIVVYVPIYDKRTCKNSFVPIIYSCALLSDGNALDIGCELPDDDAEWRTIGVKNIFDLDKSITQFLQQVAPTILCLFAKVQYDAFKCQKKIIQLVKRTNNPRSPDKTTGDRIAKSTPIVLSRGITYSFRNMSDTPRSFTRHCEAWIVRGHYRHYKSGKTVYIAPYKKGTGKLKTTVYIARKD